MAGLPWFKVHADVFDHPKTKRLCAAIKDANGAVYLFRLWAWAVRFQADGTISGPDAAFVLEDAAGWRGEAGALAKALVAAGYLDASRAGFELHDWDEYQSAHIEKLRRDRERSASKRNAGRATVLRLSRDGHGTEREGD
jgi:hypothetical protein